MTTSIQVAAKVRAFKDYALKHGAKAGEIATALKSDEQTVRNVSDLKATPEEVAEIAAGLERVAALARQQIEEESGAEETTATKSSSTGDYEPERDVFGRRVHKPLGTSPGEIWERRAAELRDLEDQSNPRDAYGRSIKKVYS